MGAGTSTGDNVTFYRVKKGKVVKSIKTEQGWEEVPYDWFEGRLTGIRRFDDEFEGQVNKQIELRFSDSETGENARIKFSADAWFYGGFFARIQNINLNDPFRLGVMPSEQNEKMSFCYLKQYDAPVGKAIELKPNKVTINGKPQSDWSVVEPTVNEIIESINQSLSYTPEGSSSEQTEEEVPF
jgi:hypothetical protein